MTSKKSVYTVSEFAKLQGWSREIVRQKCRGQVDRRTNKSAELPPGFEALKMSGDWYIYRNAVVSGVDAQHEVALGREQAAHRLMGLLGWTDVSEGGEPYRTVTTWSDFIRDSFDPKASFFAQSRPGAVRGHFRLTGFTRLLNVLRSCTALLERHDSVSITLNLYKAGGDEAAWNVHVSEPSNEPLVYDAAVNDPRLRWMLLEWGFEIEHFRKHKGIPSSRLGVPESEDDIYAAVCCECGQTVESHQKYCSDKCRDRHTKWINKAARMSSRTQQAEEIQKRLVKVIAGWYGKE